MNFIKVNKNLEGIRSVTEAVNSASVDVTGMDSLYMLLVISNSSSPTGATAQLQESPDNVNFTDVGSPVSITANGNLSLSLDRPTAKYYQIAYEISSGSFDVDTTVLLKGDQF